MWYRSWGQVSLVATKWTMIALEGALPKIGINVDDL